MSAPQLSLLAIEDSDEDFLAFERIARQLGVTYPIYRCCDGDDALDFLQQRGKYADAKILRPSLILLDLNLPGIDGREVLRQIGLDPMLQTIPVVVFTTSANPKDIEICYRYGANSYLLKPIDAIQLKQTVRLFFDYWFGLSILPGME
jgi:CheY-like chemotaxis protein